MPAIVAVVGAGIRRMGVTQTFMRLHAWALNKTPSAAMPSQTGGLHEGVKIWAARRHGSFRRPRVGGDAGVRVRRLRSERPSRWVRPMRLRRSKRGLVPETYGPSSRSRPRWEAGLLSVRRLPSAPRSAPVARRASPISSSRPTTRPSPRCGNTVTEYGDGVDGAPNGIKRAKMVAVTNPSEGKPSMGKSIREYGIR